MSLTLHHGDALTVLRTMPAESVHCCVTSPPYWGLRSYLPAGHPEKAREMGQEKTPEAFVAALVGVFREVRRVLRKDGTCWLNLGDSFAASTRGSSGRGERQCRNAGTQMEDRKWAVAPGLKPKDLCGIPWRVALALQADGWWLRQDIIWAKPNPMPESVKDRCTRAHEYLFMLTKSSRYFYDAEAIRNPASEALLEQVAAGYAGEDTKEFAGSGAQSASGTKKRIIEGARQRLEKQRGHDRPHDGFNGRWDDMSKEEQSAPGSNRRSVWTVATKPFSGAHFATFPPDLIRPCILAGCPAGGVVLDPFGGSGTTGRVALEHGRSAVLIEMNADYLEIIRERCAITPGLGI